MAKESDTAGGPTEISSGVEAAARLHPDLIPTARERAVYVPPAPRRMADMIREPALVLSVEADRG